MLTQDLFFVFEWWLILFLLGTLSIPVTLFIFKPLCDRGYLFSKVFGVVIISYLVFVFGMIRLLPFNLLSLYTAIAILLFSNGFIFLKKQSEIIHFLKSHSGTLMVEEGIFFLSLLFWSYVRGHQPDIYGLEKYMDFGFVNSILRTKYFPPADIWYPPYPINYYYFGHLATAVLTKLSGIIPNVSFNLMIATLFACTFSLSYSLLFNFAHALKKSHRIQIAAGLLGGILTALSGNLHIIYSFFAPYPIPENPLPPWALAFQPFQFPNSYWYPDATRFIPYTIHEFPIYSFVVSDLHGHVLDIPFVLFTLALLYTLFLSPFQHFWKRTILLSFFLAVLYMTNALDGPIYLLLSIAVITLSIFLFRKKHEHISILEMLIQIAKPFLLLIFGFIIFSLPFSLHFKSFVSEIGIVCPPDFLVHIGRIGPFLFEANHCQRSPLWQLAILYGFFYFFVVSFFLFIRQKKTKPVPDDFFIMVFILISTILIIVPEFVYAKDIYPEHYRANTMFKLVYQSFIMLSLVSAYTILRLSSKIKDAIRQLHFGWILYSAICILLLMGVSILYPDFAINSYYNNLRVYGGLDGLTYLRAQQPYDYQAIQWINKNIKGQPVMLEAQGDSYTMYERISANTGLPTVLGWTVHEWLWRGTYNVVAPRITEVQELYENPDLSLTRYLIDKYHIQYVYIGGMEHQKYPNLDETKFQTLGTVIYQNPGTKIYAINSISH